MPQTTKWNAFRAGSGSEKGTTYTTTWVVSLEASDLSSLLSALSPLTDFDFGKAGVLSWVITSVALRCSYVIFREQLNRSPGPRRTLNLSADRRRVLMLDTVHF